MNIDPVGCPEASTVCLSSSCPFFGATPQHRQYRQHRPIGKKGWPPDFRFLTADTSVAIVGSRVPTYCNPYCSLQWTDHWGGLCLSVPYCVPSDCHMAAASKGSCHCSTMSATSYSNHGFLPHVFPPSSTSTADSRTHVNVQQAKALGQMPESN